ncbi:ArsR/SmtB family transcription factor [Amycolatopsis sp. WGS_07]|uniref:ArsR/SmtB family transcription factor n=1 Tax=Amycolatopsis sp. WGS_07 TaxID=3076764 RepID=UPI003872E166
MSIAERPAPLVELVLATQVSAQGKPLLKLATRSGPTAAGAELRAIDRRPRTKGLARQGREAWQVLEEAMRAGYRTERWRGLRAGFDAETAWRARILARQGIRALFASLGPAVRWSGRTLEADFPRDVDLALHGHGIVLRPALLWSGHPLVAYYADRPTTLLYPALTPLLNPDSAADPLTGLLGATRARALRCLVSGRTTTGLARKLSVSVAAASLHAKALREAGLIVSLRDGKAVRHQCTPLGLDLLATETAEPDDAR